MATGDYTTKASVKQHVGIATADTSKDDLIDALIAAFSRAVDDFCHRQFYATTATRVFDCPDGDRLWLDADLLAVDEMLNGDGAEMVVGTDVLLWPYSGPPYRRIDIVAGSGAAFTYTTTPQRAISIEGDWGYAATTPAAIARACILWVADAIGRQGFEAVTDAQIGDERIRYTEQIAGGPPPAVRTLLLPYVYRRASA